MDGVVVPLQQEICFLVLGIDLLPSKPKATRNLFHFRIGYRNQTLLAKGKHVELLIELILVAIKHRDF